MVEMVKNNKFLFSDSKTNSNEWKKHTKAYNIKKVNDDDITKRDSIKQYANKKIDSNLFATSSQISKRSGAAFKEEFIKAQTKDEMEFMVNELNYEIDHVDVTNPESIPSVKGKYEVVNGWNESLPHLIQLNEERLTSLSDELEELEKEKEDLTDSNEYDIGDEIEIKKQEVELNKNILDAQDARKNLIEEREYLNQYTIVLKQKMNNLEDEAKKQEEIKKDSLKKEAVEKERLEKQLQKEKDVDEYTTGYKRGPGRPTKKEVEERNKLQLLKIKELIASDEK